MELNKNASKQKYGKEIIYAMIKYIYSKYGKEIIYAMKKIYIFKVWEGN